MRALAPSYDSMAVAEVEVEAVAEGMEGRWSHVQSVVHSLFGVASAFFPDTWPLDRGLDFNICFSHELFSYTSQSDTHLCMPIGSTPQAVKGRGVSNCVWDSMLIVMA